MQIDESLNIIKRLEYKISTVFYESLENKRIKLLKPDTVELHSLLLSNIPM